MTEVVVTNSDDVVVVSVDEELVTVALNDDALVIEALEVGLPGLPGAPGEPGEPGSDGANGLMLRSGSGAPDNGLGVNGEFYIDYTGWLIYGPKAAGVWPSSHAITGPAGADGAEEFTSGTRCLFQQTSAPTGWTKDTTHDDKALRVVSGTVGSGGSSPFSTVFGKTATDGHNLSVAELAVHHHTAADVGTIYVISSSGGSDVTIGGGTNAIGTLNSFTTADSGSGTAHTHPIDLRVKYADVIIAQKD